MSVYGFMPLNWVIPVIWTTNIDVYVKHNRVRRVLYIQRLVNLESSSSRVNIAPRELTLH